MTRQYEVHTYDSEFVMPHDLLDSDVLIGKSGGLSAIYEVINSGKIGGLQLVSTEHGALYLNENQPVEILERQ